MKKVEAKQKQRPYSRFQKTMAVIVLVMVSFGSVISLTGTPVEAGWITSLVNSACNAVGSVVGWVVDGIEQTNDADAMEAAKVGEADSQAFQAAISLEDIGAMASAYFSINMQPDNHGTIPGIGPMNIEYNDGGPYEDLVYTDVLSNTTQAVVPGNAGLFVSFGGKSWTASMLTSACTSSSYALYRNIPVSEGDADTALNRTNAIYQYTQYGYVLGQLGLDKVDFQNSMNFGRDIIGIVVLALYYASTSINVLFSIIFDVLKALNPFRLFTAGVNAVLPETLHMAEYDYVNGSDAEKAAGTALAGARNLLSVWYTELYKLSWAIVVPAFFAGLIITLLLYRASADKWKSKVKKYLIRIAFIVIGVPMLGGLYTVALDKMSGTLGGSSSPATKIVASTFMDFESWAERGRLSLAYQTVTPVGRTNSRFWLRVQETSSGLLAPAPSTLLTVRNMCYNFNNTYAAPANMGSPIFRSYYGENDNSAVNYFKPSYDSPTDLENQGQINVQENSAFIIDMLGRYIDGKFYTPGEFESSAKSAMIAWVNNGTTEDDVRRRGALILNQFITIQGVQSFWVNATFTDTTKPEGDQDTLYEFVDSHRGRMVYLDHFGTRFKLEDDAADAPGYLGAIIEDRVSTGFSNVVYRKVFEKGYVAPAEEEKEAEAGHNNTYFVNIYANGGLILGSRDINGVTDFCFTDVSTYGSVVDWKDYDAAYGTILANGVGATESDLGTSAGLDVTVNTNVGGTNTGSYGRGFGLSTISLYNYLNTQFTETSLTLYSPSGVSSVFIRHSHRSVNLVGTGFMSAIYWLSCVTMLACYVIIGYSYGLGMLFSNIGRMVEVVKTVPFAILGSLKHIALLITYTLAMIAEVILTIFLFMFFSEMLFTLPDVLTTPLALALNDANGSSGELFSRISLPVVLIIIIIFYLWFTVKALKWRKKTIHSVQEAIEAVADKFVGVKTDAMGAGMNTGGHKGGIVGALGAGMATGAGMSLANKMMNRNPEKNKDSAPDKGGKGASAYGDVKSAPDGKDGGDVNQPALNANNEEGAGFDGDKAHSDDAKDKALADSMREKDGVFSKDNKALGDGKAEGDTMNVDVKNDTDTNNQIDATADGKDGDSLSDEKSKHGMSFSEKDAAKQDKADAIKQKLSGDKSQGSADASKRGQSTSVKTDDNANVSRVAQDGQTEQSDMNRTDTNTPQTNGSDRNGTMDNKTPKGKPNQPKGAKTSFAESQAKSNEAGNKQSSTQQEQSTTQQSSKPNVNKPKAHQQAPRQSAPQQAPRQSAPQQAPRQSAPQQAPRQSAPQQAPRQSAPQQAPRQSAPQQAPRQSAPQQAPRQSAPQQAPRQSAPQQAPRQSAPQQAPRQTSAPSAPQPSSAPRQNNEPNPPAPSDTGTPPTGI